MGAVVRRRAAKRVEAPANEGPLTDTQRRILTAALEIFSQKGFTGASTAEIALRAGVAEKTLFAQFKSKRELLAHTLRPSVLLLVDPRAFDRMREAMAPGGKTLRQVLGALLHDRVEFAAAHRNKIKLIAQELLFRPDFFKGFSAMFREHVALHMMAAFADLVSRGEIRTDLPPRTLVRTLMSVMVGYVFARHVLGFEGDVDDDIEIGRIVDLLVDGLRPRSDRAEQG